MPLWTYDIIKFTITSCQEKLKKKNYILRRHDQYMNIMWILNLATEENGQKLIIDIRNKNNAKDI